MVQLRREGFPSRLHLLSDDPADTMGAGRLKADALITLPDASAAVAPELVLSRKEPQPANGRIVQLSHVGKGGKGDKGPTPWASLTP